MNNSSNYTPASHSPWGKQWSLRADTIYLNHGSFGPPPHPVLESQRGWQDRMAAQPMDFFVREYAPAWAAARQRLAAFVGTSAENLVFVDNATHGMNVVASSFQLHAGDEVLLTDHEYGAVLRIWERACRQAGAAVRIAALPQHIESPQQVVDVLLAATTPRTRLLVVSHVTSPTAIVLPVQSICEGARQRGIVTCVDGPHAPAHVPMELDSLAADFYTASLHKWLSAPFGSGFLYVAPARQEDVRTPLLSWGRLPPEQPTTWWDEFLWTGTRDPSAWLATPAAIDFMEQQVGLEMFRATTHSLAREARQRIAALTGQDAAVPDSPQWYGSMISLPLPDGDADALQKRLWQEHGIEVPVTQHGGRRRIRVSCHLYNTRDHIDRLLEGLRRALS